MCTDDLYHYCVKSVLDDDSNIVTLLNYYKELASRLNLEDEVDFANLELNGYGINPLVVLPKYRILQNAFVYLDIVSSFGRKEQNYRQSVDSFFGHFNINGNSVRNCSDGIAVYDEKMRSSINEEVVLRHLDLPRGMIDAACQNIRLMGTRADLRCMMRGLRNEVSNRLNKMNYKSWRSMDMSEKENVFIVHGHDETMVYKVKDFLRSLDLKPIVLREQPNQGATIIEKFEKVSSAVGFAIVLLTADDVGRGKKETDLKDRARQNVVFELGYFTGKFGRDHIAALCDKNVETPGDFAGVVYTPIDEAGAWKLAVAREINSAGLQIDLNKIM